MVMILASNKAPQSPWLMDGVVSDSGSAIEVLMRWIGWLSWFGLALCGLALIGFAAMMALDKNRGRSISASAAHVELLKIALGIAIISSAGAIASTFYNVL